MKITKQELIDFENEIKELFLDRKILSPIHLSSGNEDALIDIFKHIGADSWVCSTHRSHYHAILKGIPKEWLRQEILENRSIHIYNKEYKFFSSAIVGGCLSIALGIAMGIKLKGGSEKVWVFCGDMAAEKGEFWECTKYASNYDLPITFVIEDNGLSTDAPTKRVWGNKSLVNKFLGMPNVVYYSYTRGCPHVGAGQWVTF